MIKQASRHHFLIRLLTNFFLLTLDLHQTSFILRKYENGTICDETRVLNRKYFFADAELIRVPTPTSSGTE
jgi:hypothetical protein